MAKLTRTQFRRSLDSILSSLESDVQALGERGKNERRARALKDFWFFFESYLPHYALEKTPNFHREIIGMLESGEKFTAIAAPRGFAKSTLVSFAYVIWKILTGERKFIVLVSASDKLAADLAGYIRVELLENRRIKEDFGELMPQMGEEGDFTAGRTRILALGRRRAVRGFRSRQHRPDLIILDDIEKDEESLSPAVVQKTLALITGGLIPALNPRAMRFIFVGTVQQARSAAGIILRGEEEPFCHWNRKMYRAIERDSKGQEHSLWEERFPLKTLNEIRAQIGDRAFRAEFQNSPADRAGALFRAEWFTEGADDGAGPVALYIDPSPDGIKKNDYKAAVFLAKSGDSYVILEAVLTQGADAVFFRDLAAAYEHWRRRVVCVVGESNGFQGYFLKDLREAFAARGIILPLRSRKSTAPKEQRIARLAGWLETGRLVFAEGSGSRAWAKVLKEQLECFPSPSVHDDGPDALAGALAALEEQLSPQTMTFLPKTQSRFGKA